MNVEDNGTEDLSGVLMQNPNQDLDAKQEEFKVNLLRLNLLMKTKNRK
jgi:hypothetical protein